MRMDTNAKISARAATIRTTPLWSVGVMTASGAVCPGKRLAVGTLADASMLDIFAMMVGSSGSGEEKITLRKKKKKTRKMVNQDDEAEMNDGRPEGELVPFESGIT
jgi:hypothetical protein